MKFGNVTNPEAIDFTLPPDHPDNAASFKKTKTGKFEVYVGCAKWNKSDLKNFYPKGTKDELAYYTSQFNSIELNATFYRLFPVEQFIKWKETTPKGFKFFPKVGQDISHFKRLKNAEKEVDAFVTHVAHLEDKLGMPFLQMNDNFKTKDIEAVRTFLDQWPAKFPLAVEFRDTLWYNDPAIANEIYAILEKKKMANVLVDTAGRRDLLHMRITAQTAFIRYVGANHETDYKRLEDWVDRIEEWKEAGLKKLYFFVHQNIEEASPLLSAYFIALLNKRIGTTLTIPQTQTPPKGLF